MRDTTNREGLTFDEWCDAAGPGCPADTTDARRAWRLCEDPAEYRAEVEAAVRHYEAGEDDHKTFCDWVWGIALTIGGIGLALIAFWSEK